VWLPPSELFEVEHDLKVVFNLGAGVDRLLANAVVPERLPIVRLVDAGMAVRMAEYVCFAIARATRGLERFGPRGLRDWNASRPRGKPPTVGVLGAGAIFLYVGAEVSIGSIMISFLVQPEILGVTHKEATSILPFYWGGAMVGRFIGSALLRKVRAGQLLAAAALIAAGLCFLVSQSAGVLAARAAVAVGLLNSIMFPTIFTLAIEGLGKHTGAGSGVLCMAIVGGAIVPVIQGLFADNISVLYSFVIPVLCYGYIAHYGLKGHYADFKAVR
jgi:hypothetical protein